MIWRRVWFLLQRSRMERELAEEMAAHREQMGEPQDFGNAVRLREESADVWGWRWLDEMVQDARHGMRVLRRSASFTITAIVVLALGLGLNLALFQVLNAAVMKPLSLRKPETLIRMFQHSRSFSSSGVAYPVAQYVKEHTDVFASVLTLQSVRCTWGEDATSQVDVAFVSSNLFDELGGGAVHGRVLHQGEDDRSDASPVVVVSYEFWQSRLGGDAAIVGSNVRLNGRMARVAGIATAGFYGPRSNRAHVWAPIEQMGYFYPGSPLKTEWGMSNVDMYARLKEGVTEAAARDALRAPMAELGRLYPAELGQEPWLATASGVRHFRRDRDDRELNTIVALLVGLCLLILAVACANLAGLMVAHMSARTREFEMRAALGASRARCLRQLVTESGLLVAAGIGAGWFVGYGAASFIMAQTDAPFTISLAPDWRMVVGAIALGWVALLLVGLLPSLRAISNRRIAAHRSPGTRLRRVLIGVQVTGSCILLLVGGTMFRKLQSAVSTELGFAMENVAVMEVALSRYGMPEEAAAAYWRAVRESAETDRRLEGAALATLAPMGDSVAISNYTDAPGLKVTSMTVDAAFLPLLKIPIVAGRNFQGGDTRANAIIISKRLAERMYGAVDVIGASFPKSGDAQRARIVGVAADAKLIKFTASDTAESYTPLDGNASHAVLLARVSGGDLDVLRAAARRVNPAIMPAVRWMRTDFERRLEAPKLTSLVAGTVGLLALGLTSIGIFGLVAYTVSLRAREIGIRLALGAKSESVLVLVVRGLAWPVGIGTAIGTAVVLYGLAAPLSGEPLYANPRDPATVLLSIGVLAAAGVAASLAPGLRALRIDPADVLREQ